MSLKQTVKAFFLRYKPFITKNQLRELLIKTRLNERSRVEAEWQEKYVYDMERVEREKQLLTQEKDAEISILTKELSEKKAHIKSIETVYDATWAQIKLNAALAAELKLYINKAQAVQSDIYGSIRNIVDRAEQYEIDMVKKDENYKRLLKR